MPPAPRPSSRPKEWLDRQRCLCNHIANAWRLTMSEDALSTLACDRRVVTQFASACGSLVTLPLRAAREGRQSAVWGLHDIAARIRLPADLMSLSMPLEMLRAAWRHAPESFLAKELWGALRTRSSRHSRPRKGQA